MGYTGGGSWLGRAVVDGGCRDEGGERCIMLNGCV